MPALKGWNFALAGSVQCLWVVTPAVAVQDYSRSSSMNGSAHPTIPEDRPSLTGVPGSMKKSGSSASMA